MSKTFVFLKAIDTSQVAGENRREAYCPPGGYFDGNLQRSFDSKRQKRRFLASHGMRECGELHHPDKSIGGTEGAMVKRRGSKGTFATRRLSESMRKALNLDVG